MNVVIETGGAKKWRSHGIANGKIQRYIVKDHELVLVDEQENKSMGSSESLLEWIRWAAENYRGERNVLIMWDHGGDPTEGICYDENYSYSGLKQSELSTMFHENGLTTETIREKYPKVDMVIFDTCFMGNIETVSWLKNYYHYMIASEVIMPGGGLDYKVIAEEFSKNDDETFGRIVCDSFMAECEKKGQAEKTELSLYDLSQADEAISVLEDVFENELEERREYFANLTPQELSLLSFKELLTFFAKSNSVIESSKDFNLIDLKNFIEDECSERIRSSEKYTEAKKYYHDTYGSEKWCSNFSSDTGAKADKYTPVMLSAIVTQEQMADFEKRTGISRNNLAFRSF